MAGRVMPDSFAETQLEVIDRVAGAAVGPVAAEINKPATLAPRELNGLPYEPVHNRQVLRRHSLVRPAPFVDPAIVVA